MEKVAQLVGTAYPSYGYMAMAELYSDNACDKGPLVSGTNTTTPFPEMYNWEEVASTGNNTPYQYWTGVYEGIAAANQALKSIKEYNLGAAADPYRGEALLARAYGHFMLVTFFAKAYVPGGANDSPGIPYVLEPEEAAIKKYGRGTVASVYAQIEEDIEEGIPLLTGGTWAVPAYHFTPAAAHAFAARFYSFKAEWAKVVDHANLIFTGGDFTGNIRNIAAETPSLSADEYRQWFNKGDKKFNLLLHETYSVYQRSTSYGTSRYGLGVNVYSGYYTKASPAGGTFYYRSWTSGTGNYTLYKYWEYFYYTNVSAGTGRPYIMLPLLTSDEALMNRAEAYAQLGMLDRAIADCDLMASVRISGYSKAAYGVTAEKSKAYFNVTDDQEAIILTVLDFKRRAFMAEGLRWLDVLRHRITVKHDYIDVNNDATYKELGPDDNRRMFQIPESAQKASNLAPNPR
ncbi:hypothetical protein FLA_6094 [Filimonas lacunae]|nr:hypothetical protein FLA_6094 [Filimonas lacunae]